MQVYVWLYYFKIVSVVYTVVRPTLHDTIIIHFVFVAQNIYGRD